MTISTKDAQILQIILRHCDEILDSVSYFGDESQIFLDNHIYRGAVSMHLQSIGELAKQFSTDFLENTKDIPWKQIKAQRNIFAHGYDTKVDFLEVWKTVSLDIPKLRSDCFSILQSNQYEIIKIKKVSDKSLIPRRT